MTQSVKSMYGDFVVFCTSILFIFISPFVVHAQVQVSVPDSSLDLNETLLLPVHVSELSGNQVFAFDFTVISNSTAIQILSFEKAGTQSSNFSIVSNNITNQRMKVSAAGSNPIESDGLLGYLRIKANQEGVADISFQNFILNEGEPVAETNEGRIQVGEVTEPPQEAVNFNVGSTNADVNDPAIIPVSISNVDGRSISSFSLSLNYDTQIVAFDSVSLANSLGSDFDVQVTSNGSQLTISGNSTSPISSDGTLLSIHYTALTAGTTTIALAEASVNEGAIPTNLNSGSIVVVNPDQPVGDALLSLGSGSVDAGQQLSIPLSVSDLQNREVTAFDYVITYDAAVVSYVGETHNTGIANDFSFVVNANTAGEIRVSAASSTPFTTNGLIQNLEFEGLVEGTSAISFSSASLNEGEPAVQTSNGSVTVNGITNPPSVDALLSLGSGNVNEGQQLSIPLSVSDLQNREVTAFDYVITYDAAVVSYVGETHNSGVANDFSFVVNANTAGEIRVSAASSTPFTTNGLIQNLEFEGLVEGTSAISFISASLNEGNPAVQTSNGSVTVNGTTNPPSGDALLSLGSGNVNEGQQLSIPLSVSDLRNREVTAFDYVITYDAAVVSYVGETHNTGIANDFSFVVNANTAGEIRVSAASSTPFTTNGLIQNLEFEGLTEGVSSLAFTSASLNEGEPAVQTSNGAITVNGITNPPSDDITLSLATDSVDIGQEVSIPLSISNLAESQVLAFDYVIQYDESLVSYVGESHDSGVANGFSFVINANTAGEIRISAAGSTPLSNDGLIQILTFEGVAEGTSAITFSSASLNEGEPAVATMNGSIKVLGSDNPPMPNVVLSFSDVETTEQEDFNVELGIASVHSREVSDLNYIINYDASAMEYVASDHSTGIAHAFSFDIELLEAGRLHIHAHSHNFNIDGLIERLSFRALEESETTISLSAISVNEGAIQADSIPATVRIHPTEEPPVENVLLTISDDALNIGDTSIVMIDISRMQNREVMALGMQLGYDDSALEFIDISHTEGVASSFSFIYNTTQSGVVGINAAGVTPFSEDGNLLKLRFKAISAASVQLALNNVLLNEGEPAVSVDGGLIEISEIVPNIHFTLADLSLEEGDIDSVELSISSDQSNTEINHFEIIVENTSDIYSIRDFIPTEAVEQAFNLRIESLSATQFRVIGNIKSSSFTQIGTLGAFEVEGLTIGDSNLGIYHTAVNNDDYTSTSTAASISVLPPVVNPPTSEIILALEDTVVTEEDIVNLELALTELQSRDINHIAFFIRYDVDYLRFDGLVNTDYKFDEASSLTVLFESPGVYRVDASFAQDFDEDQIITALRFKALNEGSTVITLNGILYNTDEYIGLYEGGNVSIERLNHSPTLPVILNPITASDMILEGDEDQLFNLAWSNSEDVDGDDLHYKWVSSLNTDMGEESYLLTTDFQADTTYSMTYRELANSLDIMGLDQGVEYTLYHSVMVTDGIDTLMSEVASIQISRGVFTSIDDEIQTVQETSLAQNYPNPFNPSTNIVFNLEQSQSVQLSVYTMDGRRIAVLADKVYAAGQHLVQFDASNLATGIYMYQLRTAGGKVLTRKMSLIK